jgi:hypothetical protein
MPYAIASMLALIWILGLVTALSMGGIQHVLIAFGLIFIAFIFSTQRKPV